MQRNITVALAVMLAAASAYAQDRPARRSSPKPSTPSTLRVLNQRVPEVRFQETPLDQVMDWLGEYTKLNINVRWQMLVDAGIERDKPITLNVKDLRLAQVLSLIMAEAGGSDVKLGYRASGNLFVLSTVDDLNKELITKVYDVSDLLVKLMDAPTMSGFDVTRGLGQGSSGGGGGGGGGGGMFGQGQGGGQQGAQGGRLDAQGGTAQLDEIVDIIQQAIEPDSWKINGGPGSIIKFQRSLIVRNTILVHQQLGGYVTERDVATSLR